MRRSTTTTALLGACCHPAACWGCCLRGARAGGWPCCYNRSSAARSRRAQPGSTLHTARRFFTVGLSTVVVVLVVVVVVVHYNKYHCTRTRAHYNYEQYRVQAVVLQYQPLVATSTCRQSCSYCSTTYLLAVWLAARTRRAPPTGRTTILCENNGDRTVSVFVCVGRTYGIRKFRSLFILFVVFLFFGAGC